MKKMFALLALALLFLPKTRAQQGCEITVKMGSYHYDSVWLGAYYGKRTTPIFGVRKEADGSFLLKKKDGLEPGLYALLTKRNAAASFENLPIWLLDGQRAFTIETDLNRLKTAAKATGSPENGQLFAYFTKYDALGDTLDNRSFEWKSAQDAVSFENMQRAERDLQAFQDEIIAQNPSSRTAKLIAETRYLTAPDDAGPGADWHERAAARLSWQREHYFDFMDLKGDGLVRYPLWVDRVDYFAFKVSEPVPESMIATIENLIGRFEPGSPAYQYYFRYIMQSLSRITRFRTDEVYTYFTRKYADGGLLNWMKASDVARYREDAAQLEPLFAGKKVPDVTFFDTTGAPVKLYATDAPYLLVVFWMPDCSHCKKEVPILEDIYQKYRSKGLKVLSVCGKNGAEEMPKCWQFAETMAMPTDWKLLGDPMMKSDFRTALNIRSFPRFFLLDKNKVILYKQSGELPAAVIGREFARAIK